MPTSWHPTSSTGRGASWVPQPEPGLRVGACDGAGVGAGAGVALGAVLGAGRRGRLVAIVKRTTMPCPAPVSVGGASSAPYLVEQKPNLS